MYNRYENIKEQIHVVGIKKGAAIPSLIGIINSGEKYGQNDISLPI